MLARQLRHSSLIALILVVSNLTTAPVTAKTQEQTQKQLQSILLQIDKLKKVMAVKEDSKSKYLSQLRSIETDIGQVSRRLDRTNDNINIAPVSDLTSGNQ